MLHIDPEGRSMRALDTLFQGDQKITSDSKVLQRS